MEKPDSVARQREFYGQGSHEHLRAREHDHYARKIVDTLAVGVAKARGPKLKEQLEAVKKSLATLRIDDHDFDTH